MRDLYTNVPLLTSLAAILLAQFLKVPWNYLMNKEWDWNWLLHSGGMPSGHTSAATSLTTAIGLCYGWGSPSFAVSAITSIIVMYDAAGVRRQAGMQAKVLNQLVEDFTVILTEIRQLNQKRRSEESRIKLKEILGHQPIEVFTGAICGISVALLFHWIWYY